MSVSPVKFVFGSHEVPCSEGSHAAFRLCCCYLEIFNNLWIGDPLFSLYWAPRIMYLGLGFHIDMLGLVNRLDMGYKRRKC